MKVKKIIIGQKIGCITILYFCKKSLIVIKPAIIWSKVLYTLLIYFIYLMHFMQCWFIIIYLKYNFCNNIVYTTIQKL